MSIISVLNHCGIHKVKGVFYASVRTIELKEYLEKLAEAKNLDVVITHNPPPHHFKTKQEYLDYKMSNNENFKNFVNGLGLKLNESEIR